MCSLKYTYFIPKYYEEMLDNERLLTKINEIRLSCCFTSYQIVIIIIFLHCSFYTGDLFTHISGNYLYKILILDNFR